MNFKEKLPFGKYICNVSDNPKITVLNKELLQDISKLKKKKHELHK